MDGSLPEWQALPGLRQLVDALTNLLRVARLDRLFTSEIGAMTIVFDSSIRSACPCSWTNFAASPSLPQLVDLIVGEVPVIAFPASQSWHGELA